MLGRIAVRMLAAIGLLFVIVTVTPIDRYLLNWLSGPWNEPRGEVLILLGADDLGVLLGQSSYWRAIYGVRAWKEGGIRRIVISGQNIAGTMRDFMTCQGVPPDAVGTEAGSKSTHENAVNTAALLKNIPGTKVLMSSDYHMRRATAAFRKAGLNVVPVPIPDGLKRESAWQNRWSEFLNLAVELSKLGYYSAKGWT